MIVQKVIFKGQKKALLREKLFWEKEKTYGKISDSYIFKIL